MKKIFLKTREAAAVAANTGKKWRGENQESQDTKLNFCTR